METGLLAADPLMRETEAAEMLGVTAGTLSVWRSTKRYRLAFIKVGSAVRYRRSDILSFIESRRVAS